MARYDDFESFQRDLDQSDSFADDPFGIDTDVGLLDEEDLEALGFAKPKKKRRPRTDD